MIRIAKPLPNDDGPYEYRGRFDGDGLHCDQARRYDPSAGKWMNEELVGFVEGVNLYCYVSKSPQQLDLPDPTAERV